jgi:beta-lactamase class A
MGQFGATKKFIVVVCLVIIAGFFLGYRSVHAVHEHEVTQKTKAAAQAKVNEAQQLQSKLVSGWQSYLATNKPDGNVDVAVYDSKTGALAHYTNAPAGTTYNTASIVKLSILETTLYQDQKNGISGLTSDQLAQATPMIENSDNDAATDLWNMIGGAPAVQSYYQVVGTTDSTPNTTALDQIKIVNEVAYPKLLNTASVTAANNLMDNIEADQRWGVTGGVPTGVSVELKNGWLADADNNGTSGWNINSIGHVHGNGTDYTIAVLTDDNDTMQDGINTIQGLSTVAWNDVSAQ